MMDIEKRHAVGYIYHSREAVYGDYQDVKEYMNQVEKNDWRTHGNIILSFHTRLQLEQEIKVGKAWGFNFTKLIRNKYAIATIFHDENNFTALYGKYDVVNERYQKELKRLGEVKHSVINLYDNIYDTIELALTYRDDHGAEIVHIKEAV